MKPAKAATARRKAVTQMDVARHLGMSRTAIRDLETSGLLMKRPDGAIDLDATRLAYIQRLRDRSSTRTQADAELRQAKAREIQQRIEERDRRSIDIDDSLGAIELVCGLTRTELAGHSARCTRDPALRRVIERDVHGMLVRISSALGRISEALRTGVDLDRLLVHGFGPLLAGGDGTEGG
jgi:hypothetical protein